MAAALLTVMLSSTQPHGAFAAVPATAGHGPAGVLPDHIHVPTFVRLPAVPTEPRALDTLERATPFDGPEPTPVAPAPAAPKPRPTPATPRSAAPAPARSARPPAVRVRVVSASTRPARLWAQLRRGLTVTGQATWYAGTRGYAGIAHVAMPGARYLARGRSTPRARVCADGRCTIVAVVDACACRAGTSRARLVDLSATTLRRLGLDPRRGVYQVRVTLLEP